MPDRVEPVSPAFEGTAPVPQRRKAIAPLQVVQSLDILAHGEIIDCRGQVVLQDDNLSQPDNVDPHGERRSPPGLSRASLALMQPLLVYHKAWMENMVRRLHSPWSAVTFPWLAKRARQRDVL